MTPLRQRSINDLKLRNFSAGTIKVYVHAVERFSRFLKHSPSDATAEDVKRFLVAEINRGMSRSYCVIQRNALRHLFEQSLGRLEPFDSIPRPKRERRLPVVLSREEIQQLFSVIENIKHKALLMVVYDAGLRLSEKAHGLRKLCSIGRDLNSASAKLTRRSTVGQIWRRKLRQDV